MANRTINPTETAGEFFGWLGGDIGWDTPTEWALTRARMRIEKAAQGGIYARPRPRMAWLRILHEQLLRVDDAKEDHDEE